MTKPLLTDAQVRRRQKIGGHLGYTTAALGLTALGARSGAGAIRQSAKLGKFTKLAAGKTPAHLERLSNTLTTVAAGTGGAAGLNGARLSTDASRRRSELKKNAGGFMDFGLSGVQQGSAENFEDISKGWRNPLSTARISEEAHAAGHKQFNAAFQKHSEIDYTHQAEDQARRHWGFKPNPREKAVEDRLRGNADQARQLHDQYLGEAANHYRASRGHARALRRNSMATGFAGGVGVTGAGAYGVHRYNRNSEVNKAAFGAGLSSGLKTIGSGLKEMGSATKTFGAAKMPGMAPKIGNFSSGLKMGFKGASANPLLKPASGTFKPISAMAHPTAGGMGAGIGAGLKKYGLPAAGVGTAGGIGMGIHNRNKNVIKAYDPEHKRQKRMDHYATATAFGAGGLATAGAVHGSRTIGRPKYKENVGKPLSWRNPRVRAGGTGVFSNSGKAVRAGFKGGGEAALMGAGAIGAALAADRMQSYRKGRGRSYRPLITGY